MVDRGGGDCNVLQRSAPFLPTCEAVWTSFLPGICNIEIIKLRVVHHRAGPVALPTPSKLGLLVGSQLQAASGQRPAASCQLLV